MDDTEFNAILDNIKFGDVLRAIADLDEGHILHDFQDPKNWEMEVLGRRFGVRPVIAFAARRQRHGMGPTDFTGSRDEKCRTYLKSMGFDLVQRTSS